MNQRIMKKSQESDGSGWWTIDRKKPLVPKKGWTPSPSADVTLSTKSGWKIPKAAWPASLQTAHAICVAACTCFRLLGPFHWESQQSTAQEVARNYATWILRRVYHGLSSDFYRALGLQTCRDRPVRPVLKLLFWRPKQVVLHSLCVRVVGELHAHVGLCKAKPSPFSPGFGELLMAIYELWRA